MGNHVEPYDIEEGDRIQSSYTKNENWGGQINFMVPLDGGTLELCKAIGRRHEEKMRLDYEMIRALKCAELQTKGFMIRPRTRVYHMCSDIIPITAYLKEQKEKENNPLLNKYFDGKSNSFYVPPNDEPVNPNTKPFRRLRVFNGKYTK